MGSALRNNSHKMPEIVSLYYSNPDVQGQGFLINWLAQFEVNLFAVNY